MNNQVAKYRNMIGVYSNIRERRITISTPDGKFWRWTGNTIEPDYEIKRSQLIAEKKVQELNDLDRMIAKQLSNRLLSLTEELDAGIQMGNSEMEEKSGVTYGSCPKCGHVIDEYAKAKVLSDYRHDDNVEPYSECKVLGPVNAPSKKMKDFGNKNELK